MKVYAVYQDIPYDSRDVMAIFEDLGMAEAFAQKQREDKNNGKSWIYSVDEFDVVEKEKA